MNEIIEKQIIRFTLNNQDYGIDILKIQEIIQMTEITKIPNTPQFIEGVINLREIVIPIIDLRKRFNLIQNDYTKDTRTIIIKINSLYTGLIVDKVSEVIKISEDMINKTPQMIDTIDSKFIQGLIRFDNKLIILLNIDKIFSDQEKDTLNHV